MRFRLIAPVVSAAEATSPPHDLTSRLVYLEIAEYTRR